VSITRIRHQPGAEPLTGHAIFDLRMPETARDRATQIVTAPSRGSGAAADELCSLVYDELRRQAEILLRRERPGHTLQATALVHEAYLKLVDGSRVDWQGRTHFLAAGAQAMRRLLIDHARGRGRFKRGGGWHQVTLAESWVPAAGSGLDAEELLSLDAALDKLAALDARQARIVELRFYGGLTADEIAHVVGVSKRTVQGDWTHARAWLQRELAPNLGTDPLE